MTDEFSTKSTMNMWLFSDMLKEKTLFEFVEAKKISGKSGNEMPGVILLGEAIGKDGKTKIAGEFQCSVWNFNTSKDFQNKYSSWKDVKAGERFYLSPYLSRINVDLGEETVQ